jgi:hypothetical protein
MLRQAKIGLGVGLLLFGSGSTAAANSSGAAVKAQASTEVVDRDAHGDAVSGIARNHAAVGGAHNNHGGAVSEVAMKHDHKKHHHQKPPKPPEVSESSPDRDAHGDAVSQVAGIATRSEGLTRTMVAL